MGSQAQSQGLSELQRSQQLGQVLTQQLSQCCAAAVPASQQPQLLGTQATAGAGTQGTMGGGSASQAPQLPLTQLARGRSRMDAAR